MSDAVLEFSQAEYQTILKYDLTTFIERSFVELNPRTEYMHSAYIDLMAAKLEACRVGRIKRLIINLPPRSLKSHAVSVAFVSFLLGHKPSAQIICASYGQDLADKHARDTRTVMQSAFYRSVFPGTRLSADRQSVNDFMTTEKGFRMATSVGGVLTGRGADFIILDDVMKPDEALSESRRKAGNDWYANTLLSRLNNKAEGVIIVVMQRLHQDDLVGHVLENGESWDVLSLPAIATEDEEHSIETPFGMLNFRRKAGEALHSERDSLATLKQVHLSIGDYNFQSQFQQCPMPIEGGLIKRDWIRYYTPEELPERFAFVLQSWDTANKSGELNDYSVCTTWGCCDDRFYLIDVFRKRLNYPDLKRSVIEQWNRYSPQKVLIEDKSSGTPLVQDLQTEGFFGIEAYKAPPGADKLMRLNAQSVKFESGKVLIPREASWLNEYVLEIAGFPGTRNDDQVDSTTQALDYLGLELDPLRVWQRLGKG